MRARGLSATGIADQLYRIGLAKKIGSELRPLRAAVLLFADHPGALLAASGTRADIRVFHYKGTQIEAGEVPNLKKPPKTLSGPLYRLIGDAHAHVLEALAEGLTLARSGFRTVHSYPERGIKEAITNAVIHRDYQTFRCAFSTIVSKCSVPVCSRGVSLRLRYTAWDRSPATA